MPVACLMILKAVAARGGLCTLEHPADPETAPFPSIWQMQIVKEFETQTSSVRAVFPQCMWGCLARKDTCISGNVPNLSSFVRPCTHTSHSMVLRGIDQKGKFRTRQAQAYPSVMCRHLGGLCVKALACREPLGGSQQISPELRRRAHLRFARDSIAHVRMKAKVPSWASLQPTLVPPK